MNYIIRPAIDADTDVLLALSRKTINHNFRSFMGDEAVDWFIDSGMADKEILDNYANTLVLELEGKVIGLCVWHESLLHVMMVEPEHQGTGAATYFIQTMSEDKLKVYPEIYLECFESNARANAYYYKMGWEMYKSEVDSDMGWTRLFYKKA